jgi:hypothetical protein
VLFKRNDTIFTHPDSLIRASKRHPRFATNRDLYFFRFVKERYSRLNSRVECSELSTEYVRQPSTLDSGLKDGGGERDRTDDLLLAKQALSQLSYTPDNCSWWVWLDLNQRPHAYQACALTS